MSSTIETLNSPPKIAAASAKPLARPFRNQAAPNMTKEENEQLENVEQIADDLDAALKLRESVAGVRDFFLAFVAAWSATQDALTAFLACDRTRPNRARARVASRFDAAVLLPRHEEFVRTVASLPPPARA